MKNERGFTLLETIIALGIFTIASLAIGEAFSGQLRATNGAEQRSGAIMAAQEVLDELRIQDPASLPSAGSTTTNITVSNRTYQVVVTYCNPSTYCTSDNIKAITAKVNLHGEQLYEVDTVFAQLQ